MQLPHLSDKFRELLSCDRHLGCQGTISLLKEQLSCCDDATRISFIRKSMEHLVENGTEDRVDLLSSLFSYEQLRDSIRIALRQNEQDGTVDASIPLVYDSIEQLKESLSYIVDLPLPSKRLPSLQQSSKESCKGPIAAFFRQFISTLMEAHDVSLEYAPASDRSEALMRLAGLYILIEKPIQFVQWFLTLLAPLSPYVWFPYLVIGIAAVLTSMGFSQAAAWIESYHDYRLSYTTNMTARVRAEANVPFDSSYEEVVQQVMRGLVNRAKVIDPLQEGEGGKVDLLVGKTGVGKTSIALEVARRIARGQCPQELLGVEVHQVNTADLQSAGGNVGPLIITRFERLMRELNRQFSWSLTNNGDEVVVFLDEAQALAPPGEKVSFAGDLSEQVLTKLHEIRWCFAATTDTHYAETIAPNDALARRFHRIDIPLLDDKKIIDILETKLHRHYPDIEMEKELLPEIVQVSNREDDKVAQPAKALSLFHRCTQHLYHPLGQLEAKCDEAKVRVRQLERTILSTRLGLFNSELQDNCKQLQSLIQQRDSKQTTLKEAEKELTALFDLRKRSRKCADRAFSLAHRIQGAKQETSLAPAVNELLLRDHYLRNMLKNKKNEAESALNKRGIITQLTQEMVSGIAQGAFA